MSYPVDVRVERTIENRKDRLVTILVSPLMSCSARLPVYSLMITTLAGSMPTQRATALTVRIVLCVEQCMNSLPFCQ